VTKPHMSAGTNFKTKLHLHLNVTHEAGQRGYTHLVERRNRIAADVKRCLPPN
jgi:hypothetical protein